MLPIRRHRLKKTAMQYQVIGIAQAEPYMHVLTAKVRVEVVPPSHALHPHNAAFASSLLGVSFGSVLALVNAGILGNAVSP